MQAPLLFDPTGGVFFDTQTNEGTKLTKLGSEGRSTSTTITAFSILNQLNDAGYHLKDQKLLSFTDNRQDAALQAGHFNDFVQVVRLRAGIHKALQDAPDNTFNYATLGEAVFKALGLPFLEFANRSEEPPLANIRRRYEHCFQTYLVYRAVADLRRSWRIVLPNLEQCALLSIDYLDLDEVAAADAVLAAHAALERVASWRTPRLPLYDSRLLPPRIRHPQRELPDPVKDQGKRKAVSRDAPCAVDVGPQRGIAGAILHPL